MNHNSARVGAIVAIVQIAAVALVAFLSWEAYAGTITVKTIENASVRVQKVMPEPLASQPIVMPQFVPEPFPIPTETPAASVQVKKPDRRPSFGRSTTINGLSTDEILLMEESVRDNVIDIFLRGQALGNNARAFSKLGDSTIESPYFLSRFDEGPFDLGDYGHLQLVIDHYAGSFGRLSVTVRRGFHSWSALDPLWADSQFCHDNETPLACEFRLHRPSILLIRLGSNDAGVPATFDRHMRDIVAFSIEQGVVPVLGTKADRFEGSGNEINLALRQIAADFQIPLWDFDRLAQTASGGVLGRDGVHLTSFYAHDYRDPESLRRGHSLHNLSALAVLDRLAETFALFVEAQPTELSG